MKLILCCFLTVITGAASQFNSINTIFGPPDGLDYLLKNGVYVHFISTSGVYGQLQVSPAGSGQYESVCDGGFGQTEADVVCKRLGWNRSTGYESTVSERTDLIHGLACSMTTLRCSLTVGNCGEHEQQNTVGLYCIEKLSLFDVYAAIISASVVSFVVFIVIVTAIVVLICCCMCGCCAVLCGCVRRKYEDRTEINSGGAQMTVVNSNQTASAPGISSQLYPPTQQLHPPTQQLCPPTQPWYAYPPPYDVGVQAILEARQLEQNKVENTNECIGPQALHQDHANEQSVQQVNVMVEYPSEEAQSEQESDLN